jgi:hypothetical protein
LAGSEDGDPLIEGQKANKDNPVLAQIGFTLPMYRTRTLDERPLTRVDGRDINPRHVINREMVAGDIDVIVIGSGSGGSVSALNLARRGYKVLIVEAGPFYPSYLITHEERRMAGTLFKHGALQSSKNDDFIVFQGRNVGGSPTINNGICIRLFDDPLTHPHAPNPLDLWDRWGASGPRAHDGQFQCDSGLPANPPHRAAILAQQRPASAARLGQVRGADA